MAMRWHDLLFMHWPVAPATLRPHVPAGLDIDTFDGRAWLAVVPFHMTGVRPRFLPAISGPGAFPELNVRTYVSAPGPGGKPRPGVYFFTLDAASRLAVAAARASFHLRYLHARMSAAPDDGWTCYHSTRIHRAQPAAEFRARYRPIGPATAQQPGSLVSFITDRYCLYSSSPSGRIYRAEIHHPPWELAPAEASVEVNTMAAPLGVDLGAIERAEPGRWPLLHFARRMDVVAWLPCRVR